MADVKSLGRVVQVTGPVIDVVFPPGELPEVLHALEVDLTIEGHTETIICETAQHLGGNSGLFRLKFSFDVF